MSRVAVDIALPNMSATGAFRTDSQLGWLVAVSGFFLHIIVGGQRRAMGLLFVEISDYLSLSKSKASSVVSAFYITSLAASPLATLLVRWCPARAVISAGVLLVSGAYLAAAFLRQLPLLVLTLGLISGLGCAFLHAPTLVLIGQHFEKRRSLAVGVCLAGGAVGAFCFPPLLGVSSARLGFPGAMITLSGASLQGLIFAVLMRAPERLEIVLESRALCGEQREDPARPAALRTLLKQPAFYAFATAGAMATELLPLSFLLLPAFATDLRIPLEAQTLLLLLMGLPDLLARLVGGWLADRLARWRTDLFLLLLLLQTAAWLAVTARPSLAALAAFSQAMGLTGGAIFTLYVPLLVDAVGIQNLTVILSASLTLEGLFCLALPPALAAIRDASGSWIGAYYVMAALAAATAVMVLAFCRTVRRLCRK